MIKPAEVTGSPRSPAAPPPPATQPCVCVCVWFWESGRGSGVSAARRPPWWVCGSDAAAGSGRPELWRVRSRDRGGAEGGPCYAGPPLRPPPAGTPRPGSGRLLSSPPSTLTSQPALRVAGVQVSAFLSVNVRVCARRPSFKRNPWTPVVGIGAVSCSFGDGSLPKSFALEVSYWVSCSVLAGSLPDIFTALHSYFIIFPDNRSKL